MSIHLQTSNKDSLYTAFTDALAELKWRTQRSHRLIILSCYVDFDAIRKLISSVRNEINLTEVSLAFEFFEAFRGRQPNETVKELKNLKSWCDKSGIDFNWDAIRAGALMHVKGYAVVQYVKGQLGDSGVVCIGSGNATKPGLGSNSKTNVELFYLSDKKEDISEFQKVCNRLLKKSRSLDKASRRADAYEFAYTLLATGIFLHDWRDSLTSQIGIKYTLTSEGKAAIAVNDELKQLGFDIDQATINRNPLETVDFSFTRTLPKSFTSSYTVDTVIGRWCPLSVWSIVERTVERDEDFQDFLVSFREATEPDKLKQVAEQESQVAARLIDRGFVTEAPERVERWLGKIEALRNSEDKLARIFLKFMPFDLPYDYSAREQIMDLHDSLFESLAMKRNKSFVANKIEQVEEHGDLGLLELTDRECANLEKLLAE